MIIEWDHGLQPRQESWISFVVISQHTLTHFVQNSVLCLWLHEWNDDGQLDVKKEWNPIYFTKEKSTNFYLTFPHFQLYITGQLLPSVEQMRQPWLGSGFPAHFWHHLPEITTTTIV